MVLTQVSADKACPRGSGCHFLGWAYLELAGVLSRQGSRGAIAPTGCTFAVSGVVPTSLVLTSTTSTHRTAEAFALGWAPASRVGVGVTEPGFPAFASWGRGLSLK